MRSVRLTTCQRVMQLLSHPLSRAALNTAAAGIMLYETREQDRKIQDARELPDKDAIANSASQELAEWAIIPNIMALIYYGESVLEGVKAYRAGTLNTQLVLELSLHTLQQIGTVTYSSLVGLTKNVYTRGAIAAINPFFSTACRDAVVKNTENTQGQQQPDSLGYQPARGV